MLYGIALVIAMLAYDAPRSAAPTVPASAVLSSEHVPFPAPVTLPDGFSAVVDAATAKTFLSVATVDIDNDGDLDVAVVVRTLELLVWENQGSGQFARKAPHSGAALQSDPPGPALGDSVYASEWLKNDNAPRALIRPVGSSVAELAASPLFGQIRSLTERLGLSVRSSPRAPPPTRSL
jgi:hypothetical protein